MKELIAPDSPKVNWGSIEEALQQLSDELNAAASVGVRNAPPAMTKEYYQTTLDNILHLKAQACINKLKGRSTPNSEVARAIDYADTAKPHIGRLKLKLNDLELEEAELLAKRRRQESPVMRLLRVLLYPLIAAAAGIVDGSFAYSTLHDNGYPTLPSITVGIVVTLGIFATPYLCKPWISNAKDTRVRSARITLILAVAFICFLIFGFLRTDQSNVVPDIAVPDDEIIVSPAQPSPWTVAIASFMTFAIVFLFHHLLSSQKNKKNQFNPEALRDNRREQKRINGEIVEIEKQESEFKYSSMQNYELAQRSIEEAMALYEVARSKFHASYLNLYPTQSIPNYFSDPSQPFDIGLSIFHQKTSQS